MTEKKAERKQRKTKTLTIRVTPEARNAIDNAADAEGVTPTEFARKAAEKAAKAAQKAKEKEKETIE